MLAALGALTAATVAAGNYAETSIIDGADTPPTAGEERELRLLLLQHGVTPVDHGSVELTAWLPGTDERLSVVATSVGNGEWVAERHLPDCRRLADARHAQRLRDAAGVRHCRGTVANDVPGCRRPDRLPGCCSWRSPSSWSLAGCGGGRVASEPIGRGRCARADRRSLPRRCGPTAGALRLLVPFAAGPYHRTSHGRPITARPRRARLLRRRPGLGGGGRRDRPRLVERPPRRRGRPPADGRWRRGHAGRAGRRARRCRRATDAGHDRRAGPADRRRLAAPRRGPRRVRRDGRRIRPGAAEPGGAHPRQRPPRLDAWHRRRRPGRARRGRRTDHDRARRLGHHRWWQRPAARARRPLPRGRRMPSCRTAAPPSPGSSGSMPAASTRG